MASPVVLRAGLPFFERAWASALRRRANMFTLIAIGVGNAALLARGGIDAAAIESLAEQARALVRARRLSRATLRNIRRNLAFAFLYNVLGVPIAAGVLYPFTGMVLSPVIAAAAMSLSSMSAIFNASRLQRVRL
ncbi:MAG: Copper-exporting P-type ATPase [Gammaproteobacteria bacterium]|nr:Copper-exporting P-type ATPase [Gammaproteobacteria bacterium]